MTTAYHIDTEQHLVVITVSGRLTSEEFASCAAALAADPLFERSMSRLIVARGVTSFPAQSDILQVARLVHDRAYAYGGRYAVVADGPLAKGMMNMILTPAGMTDRYEFFDSIDEALAWLRVKPSDEQAGSGTAG